jgi:hypothetical protein
MDLVTGEQGVGEEATITICADSMSQRDTCPAIASR